MSTRMSQRHLLQSPFLSTFVTRQVTIHVRVSFWTMFLLLFYLSLCASTTIGPIHQKTLLRKLTTISLQVFLVYKSSSVWGIETQKPMGAQRKCNQ